MASNDSEQHINDDDDAVFIDIERMKEALESGTINIPPGLSREEIRKFIAKHSK